METIKTYLDNMFKSLPDNSETNQLKQDLYSNMEDKYNELKSIGKSENEAIGIVISEFGNIDELTSGLGYHTISKNDSTKKSNIITIHKKDAISYLNNAKKFASLISLGVLFCIFGVNTLIFLSELSEIGVKFLESFCIIPFLIIISCAVSIFIYAGLKFRKYEHLKTQTFNLSQDAKKIVDDYKNSFDSKYIVSIIVGVILCIFSVIIIIAFSETTGFLSTISVNIFLSIVSIAVFLFVYYGNIKISLDIILQLGDFTKEKKENKLIGIVAAIVFPTASLIYLVTSFSTNAWDITWIIWPCTGILFRIFSSVYKSIINDKKN